MKGKITREEIDQSLITTIDSIEQYYMIGSLEYFINNSTGKRIVVDIDITEETINVNRNNIELLIYSTINTSAFNVNGDNITITFLGNGNIKGTLKSHKTTQTTPNNTNVLFFDNGHSFVKGDLVTTSYGLGGDGKNHATCLSYNTNVNLDLRYVIAKSLTKNNLVITNEKGLPFTYTLEDNIVRLSLFEEDRSSDTIFKVIYSIN